MDKSEKIYRSILAFVFICFIFLAFAATVLGPVNSFSEVENRKLQTKPNFSLNGLFDRSSLSDIQNYISDQFALRSFFIGLKADTLQLMGRRDSNGVYIGRDGFLLQDFQPPDMKATERNIAVIHAFAEAHPQQKIHFMPVPTAVKVLEDRLPPFASPADQTVYIDGLHSSLSDTIDFIDVSDVLSAKKEDYIFYKTDHHWTTRGAYYAYRRLAEALAFSPLNESEFDITQVTGSFYGTLQSKGGFRHLKPDAIELFQPRQPLEVSITVDGDRDIMHSPYCLENLNKKDKYTIFFGGNYPLMKITTNAAPARKIMIIKDSYANCLIPFLMPHYSEITVVDLRYFNDSVSELLASADIKDVLILYNVITFSEDTAIPRLMW